MRIPCGTRYVKSTFPLKDGEVLTVKVGDQRLEYRITGTPIRSQNGDSYSALALVTEVTPSGTNKLPPSDHEIIKMPRASTFSFEEKYSTAAG